METMMTNLKLSYYHKIKKEIKIYESVVEMIHTHTKNNILKL
jgi:hypothetical protein